MPSITLLSVGFVIGFGCALALAAWATSHPGFRCPTSSGMRLWLLLLWLMPWRRYTVVAWDMDHFKAANTAGGYALTNRLMAELLRRLRCRDILLAGQGQEGDEITVIVRYHPDAGQRITTRVHALVRNLTLTPAERSAIRSATLGKAESLDLTSAATIRPVAVWELHAARAACMQAVLDEKTAGRRGGSVTCLPPPAMEMKKATI